MTDVNRDILPGDAVIKAFRVSLLPREVRLRIIDHIAETEHANAMDEAYRDLLCEILHRRGVPEVQKVMVDKGLAKGPNALSRLWSWATSWRRSDPQEKPPAEISMEPVVHVIPVPGENAEPDPVEAEPEDPSAELYEWLHRDIDARLYATVILHMNEADEGAQRIIRERYDEILSTFSARDVDLIEEQRIMIEADQREILAAIGFDYTPNLGTGPSAYYRDEPRL